MTDAGDKVVPLGTAAEVLGRSMARHEVGRRRMELILDRPDARALVQALPSEDLYYLIKDVGLEDATELVGLASPEQFQGFVDLDAWHPGPTGARLDRDRVLAWLAVARQGDPEAHLARLAHLDLEVVETVLRSGLQVVDRREEEERPRPLPAPDSDAELEWKDSPDGNFWLAFTREGSEGVEIRRILDDFYAQNPFGTARLLTALRWELDTELEHQAEAFRNARLEDMGFPPPEVADGLYAWVDPERPTPPQPRPVDTAAGFFLAEFVGRSFLDQAAAAVTGQEVRARLDRSLMYLANTVLVADRVDPGEMDQVRDAIGRMRAYLNLGLHRMSGGDLEAAARLLAEASLKHVFQMGFSQTLTLRWRAERLVKSLGLPWHEVVGLYEAPESGALHALLGGRRPRYAVSLDAAKAAGWPGSPGGREAAAGAPPADLPEGVRPFADPGDLDAVAQALDLCERLAEEARAGGLLTLPEPGPEAVPLVVRAVTAGLSALSGGAFVGAPLTADRAREALTTALGPDGIPSRAFTDALGGALGTDAELARQAADRLAADAGEAVRAGEAPDPRYVPCVRVTDA